MQLQHEYGKVKYEIRVHQNYEFICIGPKRAGVIASAVTPSKPITKQNKTNMHMQTLKWAALENGQRSALHLQCPGGALVKQTSRHKLSTTETVQGGFKRIVVGYPRRSSNIHTHTCTHKTEKHTTHMSKRDIAGGHMHVDRDHRYLMRRVVLLARILVGRNIC